MPRKGEEEGRPGKGAKRKKGRAKTGQSWIAHLTGAIHRYLTYDLIDRDLLGFWILGCVCVSSSTWGSVLCHFCGWLCLALRRVHLHPCHASQYL